MSRVEQSGRMDNIIQNLGQMKIKNWLTCVQDRGKWKDGQHYTGPRKMKIKNWLTCVQDRAKWKNGHHTRPWSNEDKKLVNFVQDRANWKDGQHHTGPWSNEDQKLVSLCTG